jgi:hypothetical protein
VDAGEVDIADVICGVVVSDLTASPVETFDFDNFTILDGAGEGDCVELAGVVGWLLGCGGRCTVWVPAILGGISMGIPVCNKARLTWSTFCSIGGVSRETFAA